MKLDRQEIVGAVVALREWLAMDHEARFARYGERIDVILAALRDVPGLKAQRISAIEAPAPTVRDGVRIDFDSEIRAAEVETALRDGEPGIFVRRYGRTLSLSVAFMNDGEAEIVARRLGDLTP
jgi:seryl-tRNA(Sec) selenium transferase